MSGCFACLHACALGEPGIQRGPKEGEGSPETGVKDDYEMPHECWQSNSSELSLQPLLFLFSDKSHVSQAILKLFT